jgi:hypothetical protein
MRRGDHMAFDLDAERISSENAKNLPWFEEDWRGVSAAEQKERLESFPNSFSSRLETS